MAVDARVLPHAHLGGQLIAIEDARVSVLDRGFLFGDAIYEVVPVYAGVPFRLESHVQRLLEGLQKVGIRCQQKKQYWFDLLNDLIIANGAGDMTVYIQVTRGVTTYRDHAFASDLTPLVFAMCQKLPVRLDPQQIKGVKTILLEDTRWARCDIKSTSLLANVLLRQQAVNQGAVEAILHRGEQVTEGAASTIMMVRDGTLICPPNNAQILPGTTRQLAVELAAEQNIAHFVQSFTVKELLCADEVIMCAATKELVPVIQIDDCTIGNGQPGPVWRRLDDAYQSYKQRLTKRSETASE